MDPNTLFEIPIHRIGNSNNWMNLLVRSIDDERFMIATSRRMIEIRDKDLKPNKDGVYLIDLEPLELKISFPNVEVPKFFELPKEIVQARAQKRKENVAINGALYVDMSRNPRLYYFLEYAKLTIKAYKVDEAGKLNIDDGKEVTTEEIFTIYGKKAVCIEALNVGSKYIELPENVTRAFERALIEKRVRELSLIPAGIHLLTGKMCYKFNNEIPSGTLEKVKSLCEDLGQENEPKGWITLYPERVSEVLKIPIEPGL